MLLSGQVQNLGLHVPLVDQVEHLREHRICVDGLDAFPMVIAMMCRPENKAA